MDLTITTFCTLDGVMQAPGGPDEDRTGGFEHGGWVVPFAGDEAFGSSINAIFSRATAFLLGRSTYEMMHTFWSQVTDPADPVATKLNSLPKHIASRSLTEVTWDGAELIDGDVVEAVRALKASGEGELQVHGSAGLIQTLLAAGDLVDAIHVLTVPVALGSGKRLFGDTVAPTAFAVEDVVVGDTGLIVATYRPTGAPATGDLEVVDGKEVIVQG